jgi:hypothetical protein
VARALAANTRAMVQVGAPGVGGDVAAALLQHTLPENGQPPATAERPDQALGPGDTKTARSRR